MNVAGQHQRLVFLLNFLHELVKGRTVVLVNAMCQLVRHGGGNLVVVFEFVMIDPVTQTDVDGVHRLILVFAKAPGAIVSTAQVFAPTCCLDLDPFDTLMFVSLLLSDLDTVGAATHFRHPQDAVVTALDDGRKLLGQTLE